MRNHNHSNSLPRRSAALALLTLTCAIAHAQSVAAAHAQAMPAANPPPSAAIASATLRPSVIDHSDRAGAQAAAERGLAEYVQRKQRHAGAARAKALAADGDDDLGRARIAGGFEVHTIAPDDMLTGRGELRQMAKASGIWRFFARIDGRPVGLVTVQRMDGRWQAVSFGAAGLAQELSPLMERHGKAGAAQLRFIRVHQAQTDLLEVVSPADLQARYAPLASARHALGNDLPKVAMAAVTPADAADVTAPAAPMARTVQMPALLDTYELLEPLRAAVKRGLNAHP